MNINKFTSRYETKYAFTQIRLIWPSKLTTGKVLFFLVRYTAFIDGAFDVACDYAYLFSTSNKRLMQFLDLTQHGLSIRVCDNGCLSTVRKRLRLAFLFVALQAILLRCSMDDVHWNSLFRE